MLEAVHSVVSNASLLRGQSEQQSSARSLAANPDSVQVAPQAPFISPYIHIDMNYKTAVLALRDPDTGDFLTTIPSDARLQAEAQDQVRRARAEAAPVAQPQQNTVTTEVEAAPAQEAAPQVQASTAAFGAFARQVASLQTAVTGGGVGGTVSTFA